MRRDAWADTDLTRWHQRLSGTFETGEVTRSSVKVMVGSYVSCALLLSRWSVLFSTLVLPRRCAQSLACYRSDTVALFDIC